MKCYENTVIISSNFVIKSVDGGMWPSGNIMKTFQKHEHKIMKHEIEGTIAKKKKTRVLSISKKKSLNTNNSNIYQLCLTPPPQKKNTVI